MRTSRLRIAYPARWAGWAALAAGAVLCVVGWYGVSGERYAERQLPYLASCSIPGAALIIAGAVLLAHGRETFAAARAEEPNGLPDEPGRPAGGPLAVAAETLMVPGGTLWHRADCPLVAGKAEAVPVDGRLVASGELRRCPICEPADGTG
ncbi:hypothetical protein SHKM778_66430 [Streptomyces sp. KM77-8]|uniref:Lipoprotein n=1 Tax=Streptomyces haneummycinicus TaxID=3074435 RepID=A0AAT9HRY1_9ACTN